jgi:hypothetical protein
VAVAYSLLAAAAMCLQFKAVSFFSLVDESLMFLLCII